MIQQAQIQTTDAVELDTVELEDVAGGGFGLTKVGTGTLTLSGSANTYSGQTTVNQGILL